MFNWEKFKEGKIAVHCDTKEKAIDFLNECYKQHLIWQGEYKIDLNENRWNVNKKYTGYCCYQTKERLQFCDIDFYKEKGKEIIKWNIKEDNMEKTFREVIADIKEGEVWVNVTAPISFIRLREDGVLDFNKNEGINLNVKYKLKRKEYTFEEAFKAYEEGKEIQSASTDKIYHKEKDFLFASYEISKKWYINN